MPDEPGARAGGVDVLPLDLVPDALIVLDHAGVVIAGNRAAELLFGYPRGSMLGLRSDELIASERCDAHAGTPHGPLADPGPRTTGWGRIVSALGRDRRPFPAQIALSSLATDEGPATVVAVRDATVRDATVRDATVRDATVRARAEGAIARLARDLEEAERTARVGSWHWDPVSRERHWSAGMYPIHGRDPAEGPLDTADSLSLVHPDDLELVRGALERMDDGGDGFTLDYRLLAGSNGWRTVHAITERDPDRPGYRGTLQDVTEVRETERALQERTETLDLLLDSAPIGMTVSDLSLRFVRVNRTMCEMLGYSERELVGMTYADITHPGDLAASTAVHDRPLGDRSAPTLLRKRYLRSDGGTVWADVSLATAAGPDGAPRYVIGQIRDVTAERAALEAQARLAAIVESSSDAIVTVSPDGTITGWNPAAERVYGFSAREAIGQTMDLVIDGPDERAEQKAAAMRALSGETSGPFDARRRRGDGTVIEISATASPIRDADGAVIGIAGIVRDITRRREIARQLELGARRLEQAELIARTGSWEWDPRTGAVHWSPGLRRLLGLNPTDPGTDEKHGTQSFVHPDDRERVHQARQTIVEQQVPVRLEHRIVRPDGHVRMVEFTAEPIVDDTGALTSVIGVVRDMTDERRARETLTAASATLAGHARELERLALLNAGGDAPPRPALNDRQLEILRLIAQGLTTPGIAKRLYLSEPTVKWHVRQILAKTGAANRTEAVARVLGATERPTA